MNITVWFLVILAYVLGPIYIGWTVTIPKAAVHPDIPNINLFYAGVFIMFFILGCLLRYHLGGK